MHLAVWSHCPAGGCPNDLFKNHLRNCANLCCRVGLVPRFVEFLAVTHENNNVHNLRVVRGLVAAGAVPPQQLLQTDAAQKVTPTSRFSTQADFSPESKADSIPRSRYVMTIGCNHRHPYPGWRL